MVLVMWIQKKSIAQLSLNESALHVQKESHLRPFVVLRNKNKKRKKYQILQPDWF